MDTLPEELRYEIIAHTPISDWEAQLELLPAVNITQLLSIAKLTPEQAFKQAIEVGASKLVSFLLSGTDVDPTMNNNWAIEKACELGHNKVVQVLLNDGRSNPNIDDSYPLRSAAGDGYIEVVKVLLSDHRTILDNEALYDAIADGHIDIVRLFLADARFDPKTDSNFILSAAVDNNRIDILRLLLVDQRVIPRGDHLDDAVVCGYVEIFEILLADKRITPTWNTLLFIVVHEREGMLELILKDERIFKQPRVAILSTAVSTGNKNIVVLLLRQGRISEEEIHHATIQAVRRGNMDMVALFTDYV